LLLVFVLSCKDNSFLRRKYCICMFTLNFLSLQLTGRWQNLWLFLYLSSLLLQPQFSSWGTETMSHDQMGWNMRQAYFSFFFSFCFLNLTFDKSRYSYPEKSLQGEVGCELVALHVCAHPVFPMQSKRQWYEAITSLAFLAASAQAN